MKSLLGYRWNDETERFEQIRFQVDEVFTRYLDNSASGFSVYSGEDQHTTYAYDREGFRWYEQDPPTRACPPGLAWPRTREGPRRQRRAGVHGERRGRRRRRRTRRSRRASRSARGARERPVERRRRAHSTSTSCARRAPRPPPAFERTTATCRTSATPTRTPTSSRSRATRATATRARGIYCDAEGNVVRKDGARHPAPPPARLRDDRDLALPLPLRRPLADDRAARSRRRRRRTYGPDLIDRWKARAFAQDPGSRRPAAASRRRTRTGAARAPCSASAWPRARDPRDVGRRLRHERDPPRDLLPRGDAPEELAARARDPAARRHLRAVGLQRRQRRPLLQRRATRTASPIDGRNDEMYGNFDDPCNDRYDQNDTGVRPGLPDAVRRRCWRPAT